MNSKQKEEVRKDGNAYSFEYLLDILKIEIEFIERGISRLDEIRKAHMNWAIVTWAGSIALLLKTKDLDHLIILTSLVPLLFWLVTARWSYHQAGFIYRQKKISDFLGSEEFRVACDEQSLKKFILLDPIGNQYKSEEDYKVEVNFWKAFRYHHIVYLHLGMIIISLILGIINKYR